MNTEPMNKKELNKYQQTYIAVVASVVVAVLYTVIMRDVENASGTENANGAVDPGGTSSKQENITCYPHPNSISAKCPSALSVMLQGEKKTTLPDGCKPPDMSGVFTAVKTITGAVKSALRDGLNGGVCGGSTHAFGCAPLVVTGADKKPKFMCTFNCGTKKYIRARKYELRTDTDAYHTDGKTYFNKYGGDDWDNEVAIQFYPGDMVYRDSFENKRGISQSRWDSKKLPNGNFSQRWAAAVAAASKQDAYTLQLRYNPKGNDVGKLQLVCVSQHSDSPTSALIRKEVVVYNVKSVMPSAWTPKAPNKSPITALCNHRMCTAGCCYPADLPHNDGVALDSTAPGGITFPLSVASAPTKRFAAARLVLDKRAGLLLKLLTQDREGYDWGQKKTNAGKQNPPVSKTITENLFDPVLYAASSATLKQHTKAFLIHFANTSSVQITNYGGLAVYVGGLDLPVAVIAPRPGTSSEKTPAPQHASTTSDHVDDHSTSDDDDSTSEGDDEGGDDITGEGSAENEMLKVLKNVVREYNTRINSALHIPTGSSARVTAQVITMGGSRYLSDRSKSKFDECGVANKHMNKMNLEERLCLDRMTDDPMRVMLYRGQSIDNNNHQLLVQNSKRETMMVIYARSTPTGPQAVLKLCKGAEDDTASAAATTLQKKTSPYRRLGRMVLTVDGHGMLVASGVGREVSADGGASINGLLESVMEPPAAQSMPISSGDGKTIKTIADTAAMIFACPPENATADTKSTQDKKKNVPSTTSVFSQLSSYCNDPASGYIYDDDNWAGSKMVAYTVGGAKKVMTLTENADGDTTKVEKKVDKKADHRTAIEAISYTNIAVFVAGVVYAVRQKTKK